MEFLQIDIKKLIPQREPMIMVERVIAADEGTVTTALQITTDNLFCSEGQFSEEGLVENIAQSAAAMSGLTAHRDGTPVKRGFIGSVRGLKVRERPTVGSEIITTVELIGKVLNVDMVRGVVKLEGRVVAECEMRIFLEDQV